MSASSASGAPTVYTDLQMYYDAATAGMPVRVSLEVGPGRGKGVVAASPIPAGAVAFVEAPLVSLHHNENKSLVNACDQCCRFVGSVWGQLSLLAGNEDSDECPNILEDPPAEAELFATRLSDELVSCDCGAVYCSKVCQEEAWKRHHFLFCEALATPEELDDGVNPMSLFATQALENNEILLLAGRVFGSVLCEFSANGGNLLKALRPFSVFQREAWWNVVLRDMGSPSAKEAKKLKASLEQVIQESCDILRALIKRQPDLKLSEDELKLLLNPELYAELVGAFELNNIDVCIPSPVAAVWPSLCGSTPVPYMDKLAGLLRANAIAREEGEDDEHDGCEDDGGKDDSEDDMAAASGGGHRHSHSDSEEGSEEEDAVDDGREIAINSLLPPFSGTGLFRLICTMNHSCVPNVKVEYPSGTHEATVIALKDISPGEELLTSYIEEDAPFEERRSSLRQYGFVCNCGKCEAEL